MTLEKDNENRSLELIKKLRTELKASEAFSSFQNLTCYAVGSVGRLEAGPHSDIDIFFVIQPEDKNQSFNLMKIKAFADFIKITEQLELPPLSNDGKYLEILSIEDMEKEFGAPSDDFNNLFTARMLLILESKWLFNKDSYEIILDRILETYFRDYKEAQGSFRPTILLNDIIRYWKTLCLNYENKRNDINDDQDKNSYQIKNLKLKYTRMLTCFGTVIAICSKQHIDIEAMKDICKKTPFERIESSISSDDKDSKENLDQARQYYLNFLTYVMDPQSQNDEIYRDVLENAELFAQNLETILKATSQDDAQLRMLLL